MASFKPQWGESLIRISFWFLNMCLELKWTLSLDSSWLFGKMMWKHNHITPSGQITQIFWSSWATWLLPTLIGIVPSAIKFFLCGTLTHPSLLCVHRFAFLIPTIWSNYFVFFPNPPPKFVWSVTAPALMSLTSSASVLKQIFVHQVQMLLCIHSASTPPPPLQSTRCR